MKRKREPSSTGMPYRKRTRRTAPRRTPSRRAYRRRRKKVYRRKRRLFRKFHKTIVRSDSYLSDVLFVKLPYSTQYKIVSGSAVPWEWTFVGNGIYDPDASSYVTDHQPRGFDQLKVLYRRHFVHGSKIRVRVRVTDPSDIYRVSLGCNRDPSVTDTLTHKSEIRGQWKSKMTNFETSGGAFLSGFQRTHPFFSESHLDGLRGTQNNNPGDKWYWHFLLQNFNPNDLTLTGRSIYVTIDILYYCELMQKIPPGQS